MHSLQNWVNRALLVILFIVLWKLSEFALSVAWNTGLAALCLLLTLNLAYYAWTLRSAIDTAIARSSANIEKRTGLLEAAVVLLLYPAYRIVIPILYFGAFLFYLDRAWPGTLFAKAGAGMRDFVLFGVQSLINAIAGGEIISSALVPRMPAPSWIAAGFFFSVLAGVFLSWVRILIHVRANWSSSSASTNANAKPVDPSYDGPIRIPAPVSDHPGITPRSTRPPGRRQHPYLLSNR